MASEWRLVYGWCMLSAVGGWVAGNRWRVGKWLAGTWVRTLDSCGDTVFKINVVNVVPMIVTGALEPQDTGRVDSRDSRPDDSDAHQTVVYDVAAV